MSVFGSNVLVECFDCHETWRLNTGSSGSTLDQCPFCGGFNCKRYATDDGLDGGGERGT